MIFHYFVNLSSAILETIVHNANICDFILYVSSEMREMRCLFLIIQIHKDVGSLALHRYVLMQRDY